MDAVGETPNIAARLQSLAAPNTVLISELTRRLVSAAFDFQDIGLKELKGVTEPLHVYCVLSAKNTASRFEAAHTGSLTPFIGRSSELSLLLDRWQKVKEGDGQVIFLSGIPGVGKSRLLHELKSQIQPEPHVLLHHQGSPYHCQSPFVPVIMQTRTSGPTNRSRGRRRQACQARGLPSALSRPLHRARLADCQIAVNLSGKSPRTIRPYGAANKEQDHKRACRHALGIFCPTPHALHLRGCALDGSNDARVA